MTDVFETAQKLELKHWQLQPGCSMESHAIGSADMLARFGFEPARLANKLILDVGCGPTGRLSALKEARIVGVDPLWNEYNRLAWSVNCYCSVYTRKAEDRIEELVGQCDLVWCVNALDHVESPAIVLENLAAYVKPDGLLFLSVDCGPDGSGGEMHPARMPSTAIDRLLIDRCKLLVRRCECGNCYRRQDGVWADSWGDSGLAFHWWSTHA